MCIIFKKLKLKQLATSCLRPKKIGGDGSITHVDCNLP